MVIDKQKVGQAISVGPIRSFDRTKTLRKGTESLHCRLGGADRSSQLDRNVMKGNREFATHLGEIEIPISETEKAWVSGSGYVK